MRKQSDYTIYRDKYKSKLVSNLSNNIPSHLKNFLINRFTIIYFKSSEYGKPIPQKIELYQGNDMFYSGLAPLVVRAVKEIGYDCNIVTKYKYNVNYDRIVNLVKNKCNIRLRDYQKRAIIKMVKYPLSSISLPTGSGKTVIMGYLLQIDDVDTLIIVDSKILMYQLAKDIEKISNKKCGIIGDGNFGPRKWTVAIIDSLLTKRGIDYVRTVEALYFDEAHHVGADSYRMIVDKAYDNVRIRRGFSGTVFRNDPKNLLLPAITGPICEHISTSDLIREGWLAKPKIFVYKIEQPISRSKWYNAIYNRCVINNVNRNKIGITMAKKFYDKGERVVIFFKNISKHLPLLRRMLTNCIPSSDIGIIYGKTPMSDRTDILTKFSNGDIKVLLLSIGTSGEGLDLPGNIRCGINLCGGSSEIAIRQVLGRLLRKPKMKNGEVDNSKSFSIYYIDFFDNTNDMLRKQSHTRLNIYKSEPEFDVKLVDGIKGRKKK